jgi:hypothetical protein
MVPSLLIVYPPLAFTVPPLRAIVAWNPLEPMVITPFAVPAVVAVRL